MIKLALWDITLMDMEIIINYLAQIDNNSFVSRYPTDTKGNPTLPDNYELNVADFTDKAERACSTLSGICMYLYQLEDHLNLEMQAY